MPGFLLGTEGADHVRVTSERGDVLEDPWEPSVRCAIEVCVGGFIGRCAAHFRVTELRTLRADLCGLLQDLARTGRFEPREPWLTFAWKLDDRGHVTIEGELREDFISRNLLRFELAIDQTFLQPIIEDLDELLALFPAQSAP